ncbi:IS5 family transposase [Bradyrhizobium barranii]
MWYKIGKDIIVRSENAAKPETQSSAYLKKLISRLEPIHSSFDFGCGKLRYERAIAKTTGELALVDSEVQLSRGQMIRGRSTTIRDYVGKSNHVHALTVGGEDGVVLSLDSTSIKAHRCASGGKGEHNQAIGRSRGGRTTKIHALSDPLCRPVVLHLTPGQDADIAAAPDVLALAPPMSVLLADKGYDGDKLRGEIIRRGAKPVIPNKSNRVVIHRFNKRAYKGRNVIERCFGRLKDFRRIATRYDKLARNFLAAVHLAALVAYWLN